MLEPDAKPHFAMLMGFHGDTFKPTLDLIPVLSDLMETEAHHISVFGLNSELIPIVTPDSKQPVKDLGLHIGKFLTIPHVVRIDSSKIDAQLRTYLPTESTSAIVLFNNGHIPLPFWGALHRITPNIINVRTGPTTGYSPQTLSNLFPSIKHIGLSKSTDIKNKAFQTTLEETMLQFTRQYKPVQTVEF